MPRHLNYVEPYFGGGSILLSRNPDDPSLWMDDHKGVAEVVNDIDRDLSTFWSVLQGEDSFARFRRAVEAVPFSEAEFARVGDRLASDDPVERAVGFFVKCRLSLAGRMDAFTGLTKTRVRAGMSNEVSAWLSAVMKWVMGRPTTSSRV